MLHRRTEDLADRAMDIAEHQADVFRRRSYDPYGEFPYPETELVIYQQVLRELQDADTPDDPQ